MRVACSTSSTPTTHASPATRCPKSWRGSPRRYPAVWPVGVPMPRVNGRLIRQPVCSLIPTADGLTVRVDDDANPEFWCEVFITAGELCVALIRSTELNNPELAAQLWQKCKGIEG